MKLNHLPKAALAVAAVLSLPSVARAQSAIIYGALSNFDIANDSGRVCHGFEIELEGLTPDQIQGSFTAQRYGAATITPYAAGTRVRWESAFDASTGAWAERTIQHTVSWFPGQCYQWNPATYQDSGCEHFGTYVTANPINLRGRWLCEDASVPAGALVAIDPPTAVPAPTYYVQPPARADNPPQLVMQVEAPQPAEVPSQYGDAQWIRIFERELPRPVALAELMADNPGVVPMNLNQLESDWQILQDEPAGGEGNRRQKRNGRDIQPTTRAIVRRIETYAFTGSYDAATHEALCADVLCNVPADGEVGELISTQMTAANVQPDYVEVIKNANGGVESSDRKISCGSKCVMPYNAGTVVTLTAKANSGYELASWTGPCTLSGSACIVTVDGGVTVSPVFRSTKSGGGGGGGGGKGK